MLQSIVTDGANPLAFRAAITSVPVGERDAWLDRVFGLDELPSDGHELPRGCVPYLPSSVDVLLRMIDAANIEAEDVFVDVGSGVGRATMLTHFLTGAGAIGIEIQAALAQSARALAARVNAERVSIIEGDANELVRSLTVGSVFFLYCPFSGDRLDRILNDLEDIARTRTIRVCSVDLPLPSRPWLMPVAVSPDLAVYRSLL